ncbi:MAG: hypothetical protein RLZZ216_712 [Cyanobacteriota bacterium]|jgi:hypothetical protein
MTFSTVFHELAVILVIAGVIGALALKLRQPLIISYIVTGIVAGPAVLGWASGGSEINLLSSIGIAVLLFVVGLKLDVGLIRSVGPVGAGHRPGADRVHRTVRLSAEPRAWFCTGESDLHRHVPHLLQPGRCRPDPPPPHRPRSGGRALSHR